MSVSATREVPTDGESSVESLHALRTVPPGDDGSAAARRRAGLVAAALVVVDDDEGGGRGGAELRRQRGTSSVYLLARKITSLGNKQLMMMYQFGVARQVAQDAAFMACVRKVHGTSGGAICAAMLVSCPDRFEDATDYFASGRWLRGATPRDVLEPHNRLLRRAVRDLGLETRAEALSDRFVCHATSFSLKRRVRNVAIDSFHDDAEVLDAIAASCCLTPQGVPFRGVRRFFFLRVVFDSFVGRLTRCDSS